MKTLLTKSKSTRPPCINPQKRKLANSLLLFLLFSFFAFDASANGGRDRLLTSTGATINEAQTGLLFGFCLNCAVNNPENLLDENGENFAEISMLAGVVGQTAIAVANDETIQGGNFVGFSLIHTDATSPFIDESILDNIEIRTYLGGNLRESILASNTQINKEKLANSPVNFLSFQTSMDFDEVQIVLGNTPLSVDATLQLYSVFTGQRPIHALKENAHGAAIIAERTGIFSPLCLDCELLDIANVVDDSDTTNFASVSMLGALFGEGSISVHTGNGFPSETVAGFAIGGDGIGNSLLNAQVLAGLSISTYFNGNLQETFSVNSPLAGVNILPGETTALLSFASTTAFNEIQINLGVAVGILTDIEVFYAFIETLCPPEILNNNGEPTNAITLNENQIEMVIDMDAIDDKDFENDGLTYSLNGQDANAFSINGSGHLTFNLIPDFENPQDSDNNNIYEVNITVEDSDGLTDNQFLTIDVLNLNDNVPVVFPDNVLIEENTPNGTSLLTATGEDADGDELQNWTISSGNGDADDDGNAAFSIDENTGEITVNDVGDLDFESVDCYNLTLTVSDGMSTSQPETISICLLDIPENDNIPIVNPVAISIDENTPNESEVVTITGTDEDGDTLIGWTIETGNEDVDNDGITPFSINPSTGQIIVSDTDDLDFELISCFNLSVIVSDGIHVSLPQTINICLNNLNDNIPVIDATASVISENSPVGTSVSMLTGFDLDGDELIDWIITNGNDDIDNDGIFPFAINPNTGEVTVNDAGDLVFDIMPCFHVSVTVSDGFHTSLPKSISICLLEIDNNNNPPIVIDESPTIDENPTPGTNIFIVNGFDPDNDILIDWQIVGGNPDLNNNGTPPFSIDSQTGIVKVEDAGDIDFEIISCIPIVVTVSDGINVSAPTTINICLIDDTSEDDDDDGFPQSDDPDDNDPCIPVACDNNDTCEKPVEYRVELLADGQTYQVWMRANADYSGTASMVNSAQVTILTQTGGFQTTDIQSITGNWENNANVLAPIANPDFDYLIFGLTNNGTNVFEFVTGEETPLFTFKNSGICTGVLELMEADDPLQPTAGQTINIGNEMTIFGFGNQNAWCGNYGNAVACQEFVTVSPRVFLQGAYEETTELMRDDLRQLGLIPEIEPYQELNIEENGIFPFNPVPAPLNETVLPNVLTNTGPDAIVDWVFIEMRNSLNETEILATRSALVQRDGDVVDVDGYSPVRFSMLTSGEYFVAIRHRNHLGAMTANPVVLNSPGVVVDFTNPSTELYGVHPMGEVNNIRMLWVGNANANGNLIYAGADNDLTQVFLEVLEDPVNEVMELAHISNGYLQGDLNMDGKAIYQGPENDLATLFFNILTYPLNENGMMNFIIKEQLP